MPADVSKVVGSDESSFHLECLLLDGAHGNGARSVSLSVDAVSDDTGLLVLVTLVGIADAMCVDGLAVCAWSALAYMRLL